MLVTRTLRVSDKIELPTFPGAEPPKIVSGGLQPQCPLSLRLCFPSFRPRVSCRHVSYKEVYKVGIIRIGRNAHLGLIPALANEGVARCLPKCF